MRYLPIFADLCNKPVLVVGNSYIAARKVEILLQTKANIKIIGKNFCDILKNLIDEKKIKLISTSFKEKYLLKVFLVIAATNNVENKKIYKLATNNFKLINVVDDQPKCSFIFPSIVNRSPLIIAISSDGKSPVLTKIIKEKLESLLPHYLGYAAQIAGNWRNKIKKNIKNLSDRRKFWESLFNNNFLSQISSGNIHQGEKIIQNHLNKYKEKKIGEIILVGAGPGHPDLLTLRALQIIQTADIILYDHLVSNEILNLVRKDSKKVYVGKQAGKIIFNQKKINKMMIKLAYLGNRVIRLKGGDPFIFGRGGEELEEIKQANIKFQVVPGITSGIGISSYSGIPLTHRKYSRNIIFLTGNFSNKKNGNLFSCIKDQTIVIYMGKKNILYIVDSLIQKGLSCQTPVALISKGTTIEQKILIGKIENMEKLSKLLSTPLILIIGQVVKLHNKLNWFQNFSDKNNNNLSSILNFN